MSGFFDLREKLTTPRKARAAGVDAASTAEGKALSVTQVTKLVEKVIRGGMPPSVIVQGEVSKFTLNRTSGHVYLTLKDAGACIDCVMFQREFARVKFTPAAGMELLATGDVRVYAAKGNYQLYIAHLQPVGQGALELAFQQMRAKLEAEGLFDPARKRPLPPYPMRIVIVSSRQAAGLGDMLKVLRRFPWIQLLFYHVPVQGEGCGPKIAAAIAHLNQHIDQLGGADLILLARGGGSPEDLWGFNDEGLARAIDGSRLPVVTGIGHDVDVSIADLVADHRAHTPTEAATFVTLQWQGAADLLDGEMNRLRRQMRTIVSDGKQRLSSIQRHEIFRRPTDRINDLRMVLDDRQQGLRLGMNQLLRRRFQEVQEQAERLERHGPAQQVARLRTQLSDLRQQLFQVMCLRLRSEGERLGRSAAVLARHHPHNAIQLRAARLDAIADRLKRATDANVRRRGEHVDSLLAQLQALSPERVLKRGYSVTRAKKTGAIIRDSGQLKEGERIITRFHDGEVESVVEDGKQQKLFE
jgi:exodeoxyribonuclease VII large subunit